MPYLIYALDYDNMDEQREKIRDEHRKHLHKMGKKLLASGAILSADNKKIIGGMSIIDTEDLKEAEDFASSDPYHMAGIRQETKILKWRKRWWEGEFFPV